MWVHIYSAFIPVVNTGILHYLWLAESLDLELRMWRNCVWGPSQIFNFIKGGWTLQTLCCSRVNCTIYIYIYMYICVFFFFKPRAVGIFNQLGAGRGNRETVIQKDA